MKRCFIYSFTVIALLLTSLAFAKQTSTAPFAEAFILRNSTIQTLKLAPQPCPSFIGTKGWSTIQALAAKPDTDPHKIAFYGPGILTLTYSTVPTSTPSCIISLTVNPDGTFQHTTSNCTASFEDSAKGSIITINQLS